MQEPDKVRRTLNALRSLGIRIAIDDFGTGYSSLSYLRDLLLPVDTLKIDRSFICDLPRSDASLAIVAAAVELAHRLGLKVVAEGVETDAQRQCLDALGCDLVHGYLVSPSVSAAAFTELVEERSQVRELDRTAA